MAIRSALLFLLPLTTLLPCGSGLLAGDDPRPLQVLRVNPSGDDVEPAQQIVLQFDRAVVPVGRMDREASEIPIDITPDPDCEWRWLNTSALSCQLGRDTALRPATRYEIVVRPGITTEDGATLDETFQHTFVTRRPRVIYRAFETWTSPGTPVVRVVFDQAVTPESVSRHVYYRVLGGERVAVTVEPFRDQDTAWTVTPADELPPARRVNLEVEPGARSPQGGEPGVESRAIVTFSTFPEARFLGIECHGTNGKRLRKPVGDTPDPGAKCDPLGGILLLFSSPVIKDVLRDHLRIEPDLAGDRGDYDPWDNVSSYSLLSWAPRVHEYHVRLPEVLRADAEYRLTASAGDIRDEFDRPLTRDIDFRFLTDHRRPRLHLAHRTSVLEASVDSHLPAVVTNLDAVRVSANRLTTEGLEADVVRVEPVPDAEDVAFHFPLKVRDWLRGRSGAVAGYVHSDPPTRARPTWLFSEVTPFHVHVKLGHYNTVVWVTDLQTGKPVKGATVEIVPRTLESLAERGPLLARTTTDRHGMAMLPGADVVDPDRSRTRYWRDRHDTHLFVQVTRGGDFALVPLAEEFHVDEQGPGSTWIATTRERRHGHIRTWGVTAQGVYRAGDTIEYKIWVRNDGNEALEPAPASSWTLRVVDPMDRVVHQRTEVDLDEFGGLDGAFKVPESGSVGWYRFELRADFAPTMRWQPLTVLVSDFTPAPFRVTTDLGAELFGPGEAVQVSTRARLHSGGPYADAGTRVTATLRSAAFRPSDSEAAGFRFETGSSAEVTVHRGDGSLDAGGDLETAFDLHAEQVLYGVLTVESAVRDDRGKHVAGRGTARYSARDRFVGIRQDDWILESGKSAEVLAVVTDAHGKVVDDTPVEIIVERRHTEASRVKGAGNAYLTHYTHTWIRVAECREVAGAPSASCPFTPDTPGRYRMTASIRDTAGRSVASPLSRWTVGPGQLLWDQPPGHHLQILPENDTVRVGDRARFLVMNPFPGARAWITVERNGVLESRVETFSNSTEVIEVRVEPDHVPGFYLSATVMSPRVEAPPVDGSVDLGKPAFRVGYARVSVRDPYKELDVEVAAGREIYEPGDRVAVDIRVRTRKGGTPETELAVAVLDEAVLDLISAGADAFDPYRGFYELGPLDVVNYNLLKNLVGARKFESKGANPGGGGGPDPSMRSDFKFVSYWNPAVRPDRRGRARVEFEVPDNLTGWRVLVMAVTPDDRMGLGQGAFRVNRDTEVRPALPNQVVEGDRFEARFTVMNRTDQPRSLEVSLTADGSVQGAPRHTEIVGAEPFKRYTVALPVATGRHGEVRFEARAGDAMDADGLSVSVPVRKRKALETAATYGSSTADEIVESVRFPDDIRTDVGELSVVASPTVIGNLEGAFEYLRDYPYACWEQRLTKGVMAAHYTALRDYLPETLEWPEAAELPRRTLDTAANFQAPNGGMAYWVPRDKYVSPYLSAYTALAFRWLAESGHAVPAGVESRLHDYLLELLRRDSFPTFFSKGMASSVRAVALAALAPTGKITRADLERYRGHVDRMDLFGKAHYLQAAVALNGTEELQREVRDTILGHAYETAGKVAFTERLDNGFTRILHSSLRSSCAVLSALVGQGEEALEASGAADLPLKLVRSVTQTRGGRHHWENTQENMFCANALIDYADVYEAVAPRYTVDVRVGDEPLGSGVLEDLRQDSLELSRPIVDGDPGRATTVRIARRGQGRLYYAVRLSYSPATLKAKSINAGIEIRREYSVERDGRWEKLERPTTMRQGELVRVDLYLDVPAPRNYVVVDDPVPGGLEPVNRDLATASTVDAAKGVEQYPADAWYHEYDDWWSFAWTRWSFYHRELRHDSARFYSDYLPAGRYHLSYVAQAIVPGEFAILPVHAGEMYDPDVFGQGVPGTLEVESGP